VTVEHHTVSVAGERLAMVLHVPDVPRRAACVVACHGLGASKDSDKYVLLGAELPAAGLALARFDFRGCGESSGVEEETTVGTRVEDVRAVLAYLERHPRLDGRFGLLGSSMGGYVALHVAAAGDGIPVVTWNAPSSFDEVLEREGGDAPGLGVAFVLELAEHVYNEAPRGVPHHLVIQGEADDVVPLEHGLALHARAADPCDIVLIPGADHRLTDPAHRKEAVARSLEWFQRFLAGPR
jgi:alpha-beta hydrolase superfamily lysophospholipase